jgi:iron complex outermembrane recepter protein
MRVPANLSVTKVISRGDKLMAMHAISARGAFIRPLNLAAIMAVLTSLGNVTFANDAAGPTTSADLAAQSAPDPAQSGSDATFQLQPVIVTATRRAEPINRVPISIQALSGKTIKDLDIQTFSDLVTHVPGVTLLPTTVGTTTNVAIRGIYSASNAPTTEVYVDDTPISVRVLGGAGPQGSPYPDVFDLDRIEVLRGPQGTLFGSSAMGGVIRYITPQPDLFSASGFAKSDLEYTQNGEPSYDVGAAYGAPVSSGVAAFRVSLWERSAGGWINDVDPYSGLTRSQDGNSSASYVVRPAFTVAPVAGLTITAAMFLQRINQQNPDAYWVTLVPQSDQGSRVSGFIPQPSYDDLNVPSLSITYDFHDMTFQSNSSYVDRTFHDIDDETRNLEGDYAGMPLIPGLESFFSTELNIESNRVWQQEFRLSSANPDSRVSWIAGLYYRNALAHDEQLITPDLNPITEFIAGETSLQYTGIPDYYVNGIALNSYTNFFTRDVSEAIYGSATVGIIGALKANVGVRAEHSIVDDQQEAVAGPFGGVAYSNSLLPDQIGNPITPRFGLTYQLNSNDMVYASAAKGYRSGGGNAPDSIDNPLCVPSVEALGLNAVPLSFNSDSLWSYEVGTKDSMLERRLAFQLSAYDIIWNDIQTEVSLPSCSEGFTANRGKAFSRGVDLQVQALVGEHLQLNFSAGYDDAYYPSSEYGAPKHGVAPLLVAAGEKLADVVPWSLDANADYSRSIDRLWSGAESYLRLDYARLSGMPSLDPNVAGYDPLVGPFQDQGYSMLNLRVGVMRNGLDLSFYVENATNADPLLRYAHSPASSPLFTAVAIRPRTIGVGAAYSF